MKPFGCTIWAYDKRAGDLAFLRVPNVSLPDQGSAVRLGTPASGCCLRRWAWTGQRLCEQDGSPHNSTNRAVHAETASARTPKPAGACVTWITDRVPGAHYPDHSEDGQRWVERRAKQRSMVGDSGPGLFSRPSGPRHCARRCSLLTTSSSTALANARPTRRQARPLTSTWAPRPGPVPSHWSWCRRRARPGRCPPSNSPQTPASCRTPGRCPR